MDESFSIVHLYLCSSVVAFLFLKLEALQHPLRTSRLRGETESDLTAKTRRAQRITENFAVCRSQPVSRILYFRASGNGNHSSGPWITPGI